MLRTLLISSLRGSGAAGAGLRQAVEIAVNGDQLFE